jgi:hypothetical protein
MRARMYGILLNAMFMGIAAILVSLRPEVMWILLGVFGFGMAMSALITLNRTICCPRGIRADFCVSGDYRGKRASVGVTFSRPSCRSGV